MSYYSRVLVAIDTAVPFLVPSQAANLAFLVSAILIKRSLCLTELPGRYRRPQDVGFAAG